MSPLIIIYFSLLSSVNFCFIILEFVIRDYNHKILIYSYWIIFIIIQFNCSVVFDSLQLHKSQHARSPSPSPTPSGCGSPTSLKLMSIKSVMPSSHLIICNPLLFLSSIPPNIRVFFNESTLHMRWPKYGSFSLSISPSNENAGLISFGMDWLDLLAVQGQKHQCFSVQLSSQSNSHIHT